MKAFLTEIRGAVMATLMLAVVCCGIYPLVVFGIGQTLFHTQANGSLLIDRTGSVRGSRLLGQQFAASWAQTLAVGQLSLIGQIAE